MYIQPQTNVKTLYQIPLDNTYDHTLYFATEAAQRNYFMSHVKYHLTNYSYQRANKGVIRIMGLADNYYDCNYLMFQNTAYGNKWFYAFVTQVDYVNDSACDLHYEIDVLQTWHFDYTPDDCFVEREHTASDAIGEHIEPEGLAIGETVMNDYGAVTVLSNMVVAIAVVDNAEATSGSVYDGVFGAAEIFVYDVTDVNGINAKVNEYVQKPDAIIGMYMFPKNLLVSGIPSDHKLMFGARSKTIQVSMEAPSASQTLDGYLPANKKLYTYPYNFVHVDNASGSSLVLRFEFFTDNKPKVEVSGLVTQPVSVVLRPYSYKGSQRGGSGLTYPTFNGEMLQLEGYPICSWKVDSYQAWVAQNAVGTGIGLLGTVGQAIGQAASGNLGGAIGTVLGAASDTLTKDYAASIKADMSRGSLSNGGVNVASYKQQFYWGRASINKRDAKRIDDFFSRFGYNVGVLKVPNRNVRPHWCYCKTAGCTLTGSIPADDMRKICSIYDAGITWWKNPDEVGNYRLNNSV